MLEQRIKTVIKDVPDFPKEGIVFKDITPLFLDPVLSKDMTSAFVEHARSLNTEIICGLESRGFLLGVSLAQALGIPFVLIRKAGKLPRQTRALSYDLEYGSATIEIHETDIPNGSRVLIHDDLLATGGTAKAAVELIQQVGGEIVGFSFIIELDFLNGREKIDHYSDEICSLVRY